MVTPDFMPSCGRKPIIYTCFLCRTNFLDIDEISTHNVMNHISLMRLGHIKISKVEHETHISWSYREKCCFQPNCVGKTHTNNNSTVNGDIRVCIQDQC